MGNLNNIAYAITALASGVPIMAATIISARLWRSGYRITQMTMQCNTVLAPLATTERRFELMDQRAEIGDWCMDLVGATLTEVGTLSLSRIWHRPTHWTWHWRVGAQPAVGAGTGRIVGQRVCSVLAQRDGSDEHL
ncbi:MAG: hypothetical protein U0X20_07995 [Caldilineaceae bacterium]